MQTAHEIIASPTSKRRSIWAAYQRGFPEPTPKGFSFSWLTGPPEFTVFVFVFDFLFCFVLANFPGGLQASGPKTTF